MKKVQIMRGDDSGRTYKVGYGESNYIKIIEKENFTQMQLCENDSCIDNNFYNTSFHILRLLLQDEIGRTPNLNEVFFRLKYGFQ